MKLYVYVLEAKDLHIKDSFVKLRIGTRKAKTRILRNNSNPVWNEEFVFKFRDLDEELVVSVFEQIDESGFFNGSSGLMGRVRIPIWAVAAEDTQTLTPTWFSLQRSKTEKFINEVAGKVLLMLSLHGKDHVLYPLEDSCISSHNLIGAKCSCSKAVEGKHIKKTIADRLERLFHKNDEEARTDNSSELSSAVSDNEECMDGHPADCSFEEAIEALQSRSSEQEMPENLPGSILLDQVYVVSSGNLNRLLFAPDSQFRRVLAEHQGTTNIEEENWSWKSGDVPCLSRVVSYKKSVTKLVGAVKATEEQTYIKANGCEFAVLTNVSTPEVPYGNAFKVELLYKIMPGPELISGEESCHFVVSWGINFLHSTMMKGMIERGVRQGLEEGFVHLANVLAEHFKIPSSIELSNKDHVLSAFKIEHQSDCELAVHYFWNFTIVSTTFMLLYLLVHILFCKPNTIQGFEFTGLDLPDTLGELVTAGILVLQLERVYNMVSRFIQARLRRGSDHGVKAQGDGWVLTIALIEGNNISSLDSSGSSDPCVVFTCNGRKKTSSVELQTHEPQWNEILEFDAMEEPPSVLYVEVFDFDGPLDQATSLGHGEINFLKYKSTELADIWVPLEGKLAQSSQSKLHLRIFLDNANGVETIREYLTKKGKEVGKKLHPRSPYRNSTFQKFFGLPAEEFLVSDFTCSLKRKMPLQGRLFLSARIVGFYANFFGQKTKFFFLWEDIEDIQVLPPSLASLGSPSLVIILRQGRGLEASHGAKSQDEQGRLRFYIQSFVSFNVASSCRDSSLAGRLWACGEQEQTPNLKPQIPELPNDSEERLVSIEDTGCFLDIEAAKMSKLYVAELPVNVGGWFSYDDLCFTNDDISTPSTLKLETQGPTRLLFFLKLSSKNLPDIIKQQLMTHLVIKSLMESFDGGKLERRVMEKSGCLNYTTTPWEFVKPDFLQRRVSYQFNHSMSIFEGKVTCIQQKHPMASSEEGCELNEVVSLHDVPLGDYFPLCDKKIDHFNIHLRYCFETSVLARNAFKCKVFYGITWLKNTKLQRKITQNAADKFGHRLKGIFEVIEREILLATQRLDSIF